MDYIIEHYHLNTLCSTIKMNIYNKDSSYKNSTHHYLKLLDTNFIHHIKLIIKYFLHFYDDSSPLISLILDYLYLNVSIKFQYFSDFFNEYKLYFNSFYKNYTTFYFHTSLNLNHLFYIHQTRIFSSVCSYLLNHNSHFNNSLLISRSKNKLKCSSYIINDIDFIRSLKLSYLYNLYYIEYKIPSDLSSKNPLYFHFLIFFDDYLSYHNFLNFYYDTSSENNISDGLHTYYSVTTYEWSDFNNSLHINYALIIPYKNSDYLLNLLNSQIKSFPLYKLNIKSSMFRSFD